VIVLEGQRLQFCLFSGFLVYEDEVGIRHGDQVILFVLGPLIDGKRGVECRGVIGGCFVADIEGDCGVIFDTDNGGSYCFK